MDASGMTQKLDHCPDTESDKPDLFDETMKTSNL